MENNIWEEAFLPTSDSQDEEKVQEVVDTISDDLSILIHSGRLTSTFDYMGHRFTLKTLKLNEELQASNIASSYVNAFDQGTKAFITAIVCASIETVDGNPLVAALGPNDETLLNRKFTYVLDNYYWFVVEHIYEKYSELLSRMNESIKEFKKK